MRGPGAPLLFVLLLSLLGVAAVRETVVRPIRDVVESRACLDFDGFFYGAQLVQRGQSYYDYRALKRLARAEGRQDLRGLPITTAPVFATLPFMALSPLPYERARIAWHALTLLAAGVAFLAIRAGLIACAGRPWQPWQDLALGVLFLALLGLHGGVRHHLCNGQTNLHVLMLASLAAALLALPARSGRLAATHDALIGLALALAILSKVFPAILLPVFVLAGRWQILPWTLLAAVVLVAATLPLTGLDDYLRYPGHFSGTFYFGAGGEVAHNLSFKHSLHRWLGGPEGVSVRGRSAVTAVCALPVAWVYGRLWLERRRHRASMTRPRLHVLARYWQVLLLIGCIMSSYWEYHMVMSFGALALLVTLQRPRVGVEAWPAAFAAASVALAAIPVSTLLPLGALAPTRQLSLAVVVVAMEIAIRRIVSERVQERPASSHGFAGATAWS